jgi:hypothetical protein
MATPLSQDSIVRMNNILRDILTENVKHEPHPHETFCEAVQTKELKLLPPERQKMISEWFLIIEQNN